MTRSQQPLIFEMTQAHLKLLSRLHWLWDDGAYDGAPAVNLKRPYGNSDVEGDVAEILGIVGGEDEAARDAAKRLGADPLKVHKEMLYVLQIICAMQTVELGKYRRVPTHPSIDPSGESLSRWERVP